jgi:hypothetical protein
LTKSKPAALASDLKYAARFDADKARQQRRYCDAFALWRYCHYGPCLRTRRCRGDADACLAKAVALDRVPRREQWRARQNILTATLRNIGAPKRGAAMHADRFLFETGTQMRACFIGHALTNGSCRKPTEAP